MEKEKLSNWIKQLIRDDKLYQFYKSKEWKKLKEQVLQEAHYECEWCKKKGKITRAVEVHHVQLVRKHPELALSKYYTFKGQQYKNLIPLCHDCHDKAHERMKYKKREQFNEERW